jgi:hypothetical protein
MNKNELIAIIDLAWQDIKALEPEALGLITIVVGRDGDEMTTAMGSTMPPPSVVRHVIATLSREWAKRGAAAFDMVSLDTRKAV